MACGCHRTRPGFLHHGACCVALTFLMAFVAVPWTGMAQEDSDHVKVHVVRKGETLHRIAGANGVTVDELREWNGLRGTRILVGQELRIPAESEYYRVRTGDTLGRIARDQDVPLALLRQLNELKNDRIYPGQRLKLQPSHVDEVTHVVVSGETLSEIASSHKMSTRQLRDLNGLKGSRILVGQRLRLREAARSTHIVERGDALWEIARAYKMSVKELRELNGLTHDRIYPGQELVVRASDARPKFASYSVRRGDTLGEIAQLHQMSVRELMRANQLRTDRIRPGQKLKVSPILGDDSAGLGLLSPENIPWSKLVPASTTPAIVMSNGPYYYSRPKATAQKSRQYTEGSPIGPWRNYQRARKLFEAFDKRVDEIRPLSHQLDGWNIVIDPGHGGVDPGTIVQSQVGNGKTLNVVEDEYVYDIALRMYVLLRLHGANVTLTLLAPNHLLRGNQPATDTFVHERNEVFNSESINRRNAASSWPRGGARALGYRRDIAARAFKGARKGHRLFLSIHADNSPKSPEGVTVFYHESRRGRDRDSRRFARALLPALGAGARTRGFNLAVLRGNQADAAVLVEIRNLAYASQTWALRYEKLRQRDAEKLVKGLLDWSQSNSAIAMSR